MIRNLRHSRVFYTVAGAWQFAQARPVELKNMRVGVFLSLVTAAWAIGPGDIADLQRARDRQDRAALEKIVADCRTAAVKQPDDAEVQYRLALAESFSAEVAVELRDKPQAKNAAESGIQAAEKAVALKSNTAEYHRILGTLCGQMISSNGIAALRYGKCALDSVNRAIELDPKSADAYVSHGVGNYYLPQALGGGIDLAIKDFRRAIELNPKSADAYLWLGVALRKSNQPAEAHLALAKAVDLNPNRIWAKQQLEKTPAQ
jgi:tetratricopeptide (TPR) repeat protein